MHIVQTIRSVSRRVRRPAARNRERWLRSIGTERSANRPGAVPGWLKESSCVPLPFLSRPLWRAGHSRGCARMLEVQKTSCRRAGVSEFYTHRLIAGLAEQKSTIGR